MIFKKFAIEVAQFLSSERGRRRNINIKLIDNNELIGKSFKDDKFQLPIEVNEKTRGK